MFHEIPVSFPGEAMRFPRPLPSQVSAGPALTRHVVGTHGAGAGRWNLVYDEHQQLVMAIRKHKHHKSRFFNRLKMVKSSEYGE